MKVGHEDFVETVMSLKRENASHVLRFGAKIGAHESPVSYSRVREALLAKGRYPAEGKSIGIEILGNVATDGEETFWRIEPDNLRRQGGATPVLSENHILP